MPRNRNIVVTGCAGLIGSIVRRSLAGKWHLTGVDINEVEDVPFILADINDRRALIRAFKGASAVVHLAANAGAIEPWENVIEPNINGTRSVFEAARLAGVRKVVFASSNHVTGLYEGEEPYRSICTGHYDGLDSNKINKITHTWPIGPDGPYGVSKAFGETPGRYYAETFGIEILCLRIGSVNVTDRPTEIRNFATLFAHSDCASLIEACLFAEGVLFDVFYGVSANMWSFWDTNHAKDILGWIPQVNAEIFR